MPVGGDNPEMMLVAAKMPTALISDDASPGKVGDRHPPFLRAMEAWWGWVGGCAGLAVAKGDYQQIPFFIIVYLAAPMPMWSRFFGGLADPPRQNSPRPSWLQAAMPKDTRPSPSSTPSS